MYFLDVPVLGIVIDWGLFYREVSIEEQTQFKVWGSGFSLRSEAPSHIWALTFPKVLVALQGICAVCKRGSYRPRPFTALR